MPKTKFIPRCSGVRSDNSVKCAKTQKYFNVTKNVFSIIPTSQKSPQVLFKTRWIFRRKKWFQNRILQVESEELKRFWRDAGDQYFKTKLENLYLIQHKQSSWIQTSQTGGTAEQCYLTLQSKWVFSVQNYSWHIWWLQILIEQFLPLDELTPNKIGIQWICTSSSPSKVVVQVCKFASPPVWPDRNCQMSIKAAQKWFH